MVYMCVLTLFVAWEISGIEQIVVAVSTYASKSECRSFHAFPTSTIGPEACYVCQIYEILTKL